MSPGFFLSCQKKLNIMTNKIIIDAWNVIWKMPDLSLLIPEKLEQVRSKFNVLIKNYYTGKNVDYKIIYDGQPSIYSQDQNQDSRVSFSRNPEKADDVIVNFIKKQSSPGSWTVITSDRHLSHRARNAGAQILSTESFIGKINRPLSKQHKSEKDTNPQIKKEDISYWLDKFDPTE